MPKVRLKPIEGYEGNKAWTIINHPMPEPEDGGQMDALLTAHDIIEHVNGWWNIGSVEDELEALGCIWLTRGQLGDMNRNGFGIMYSAEQNIGFDVARNLEYIPHRKIIPINTREHDEDYAFREMIDCARETLRSERWDEWDYQQKQNANENLERAIHYLRRGYNKGKRKYGRAMQANSLFWNVVGALEYRYVEEWYEYELQYTIKTRQATLREIPYEDEY